MRIVRPIGLALGVATLVLAASVARGENSLPVKHPEPITIQILDGKRGVPLAHVHLQIAAGYDERDLRRGLWSMEAFTDRLGRASMPGDLKDFSFVEVFVLKHKLCAAHGRASSLLLDDIRNQGLSTPNYCGMIPVDNTPGVLYIFAKARHEDLPPPVARDRKPPTAQKAKAAAQ